MHDIMTDLVHALEGDEDMAGTLAIIVSGILKAKAPTTGASFSL